MLNRNIQPKASVGDLVNVAGYANRVFTVEETAVTFRKNEDTEYSEVVYDLTCPFTFEYIIAEEAEVTIVCKEADSDDYLTQIEPHNDIELLAPLDFERKPINADWLINLTTITPADVAPKRKPTRRAVIDGLLDELITLQIVVDVCGTDEDYAVRITDVKAKLKELAEPWRN